MAKSNCLLHFLLFLLAILGHCPPPANAEMHCLVARPGFGLVSERCPVHTVACRIRIEHEAVSFYEYSPLYDRNQFVCVHNGEFGVQKGSGCVRKRSGHIRCWCFGRSNCNTPENSKLLYSSFVGQDEAKFLEALKQVDFTDLAEEKQFIEATTKSIEKTSTTTAIANPMTMAMTASTKSGHKMFMEKNMPLDLLHSKLVQPTATGRGGRSGNEEGNNATTMKTPAGWSSTTRKHQKSKHGTGKEEMSSQKKGPKTSTSKPAALTTASAMPGVTASPAAHLRSEYDRHNRIHIIHVSARDRYEPVNVFGSEALQRIMEKERKMLRAEVETARTDESLGVEEEVEELEEDWEWPEGSSSHEADKSPEMANLQPRKVAERSQTASNKLLKVRLEQRQRSTSSASNEESNEQEEKEEEALANEYFDSPLSASASSSSSPLQYSLAMAIIVLMCSIASSFRLQLLLGHLA